LFILLQRQADLLHIAQTGGAARIFAGAGENGKQNRRQYRDNGDNHQKFDQSEAGLAPGESGFVHGLVLNAFQTLLQKLKGALNFIAFNYTRRIVKLNINFCRAVLAILHRAKFPTSYYEYSRHKPRT
jgi:hypothetical protein